MYGDRFGEFVCGYWDLKGLTIPHLNMHSLITLNSTHTILML